MTEKQKETWAIVELMGHISIVGRITKPGEYGGLWQLDIPEDDTYRTEFFGSQAVYRIRIVSEKIARAHGSHGNEIIEYDADIITREEHLKYLGQAKEQIWKLQHANEILTARLTRIETPILDQLAETNDSKSAETNESE